MITSTSFKPPRGISASPAMRRAQGQVYNTLRDSSYHTSQRPHAAAHTGDAGMPARTPPSGPGAQSANPKWTNLPSLAKTCTRPIARSVPCDHGSYYRSSRGFESRHILWRFHRYEDHFVFTQGRPRSGLSTKAALHQQPRSQDRPLFQRL